MWCAYLFFSGFYKYGKNMGLSQLKTGSRKYGWDIPSPAFRPIFIFFRKYRNRQDKYKDMAGRDASLVTSQRHPTIQVYCYYCFVYSQSQEYKIHLIKRLEVLVGIYHEVSCRCSFDLIWELYLRIKHSGLLIFGSDSLNAICNAL